MEKYIKPSTEVIEMELEGRILEESLQVLMDEGNTWNPEDAY